MHIFTNPFILFWMKSYYIRHHFKFMIHSAIHTEIFITSRTMYCLYNSLLVSILLACLLERTSSLPIINELVKREKSNNPVLIDAINAMTAVESIMVSLRMFTIILNYCHFYVFRMQYSQILIYVTLWKAFLSFTSGGMI